MTKDKNLKKRILTSILLLILLLLILKFDFILVYSLILISTICIIEFLNLTKKINSNIIIFIITNLIFALYIFVFCLFFFYFSNFTHLRIITFSLLLCCVSSDIGGFIFGKILKGPKLTKISPNKTLSGAIGSLVSSGVFFSILIFFFTNNLSLIIFCIGIFTSMACQLGDLFFSYLKRKAKIKDTGNMLPGHGGFLDRFDGILFGVPTGFFISIFLL